MAGTMTLYCGVLFSQPEIYNYPVFVVVASFALVIYNILFMVDWMYMFLSSLKLTGPTWQIILQIFASLLFEKYEFQIVGDEIKKDYKWEFKKDLEQEKPLRRSHSEDFKYQLYQKVPIREIRSGQKMYPKSKS